MVKSVYSCLLLIGIATTCQSTQATKISVENPFVIEKNGAFTGMSSAPETAEDCKEFTLTPRQVQLFFSKAKRVTSRQYNHDLDMSNCRVEGHKRNRHEVFWTIDRFKRGQIVSKNKPEDAQFFYCPDCNFGTFYED